MVTSFPSQVTTTCGKRTLRESCPLGRFTRSCMPSSWAFIPSGIVTFLTADIITPSLVDVPEQFAANAFFSCLHVGDYTT